MINAFSDPVTKFLWTSSATIVRDLAQSFQSPSALSELQEPLEISSGERADGGHSRVDNSRDCAVYRLTPRRTSPNILKLSEIFMAVRKN